MQTGEVGSKYDDFWAGLLPLVRAQAQLAAAGSPAAVSRAGPDPAGRTTVLAWNGGDPSAEDDLSSGAHATSLGKTVAASGVCGQWPEHAFRFTVVPTATCSPSLPPEITTASNPSGAKVKRQTGPARPEKNGSRFRRLSTPDVAAHPAQAAAPVRHR